VRNSRSHDEGGLRQLGAIFVPKMDKANKGVVGATVTLCGRARVSFGVPDGRVMAVDGSGRLVAMPAEGAAVLGSLLVLDGDGDQFALRANNKGQYLSVCNNGTISCKMSGWGGFSANEVFEIVVEDTDEGQRVSIRAANGKFLGVDAASGRIVASKTVVLEDELFRVIPRSTEGHAPILEPAGRLRVGVRTLEERAVVNRLQVRDRARNCQKALVRAILQEEGVLRLPLVATHVWERERPRALLELPQRMAAAGCDFVTVHLTNLLRNLFYCGALVSMGALPALVVTLGEHALLVSEASLEVPVMPGAKDSPAAATSAVKAILTFILSQGEGLYREPSSLLARLLKQAPGGCQSWSHGLLAHIKLLACLLACLPACLLACLPACLLACLPACLLACLRVRPAPGTRLLPSMPQILGSVAHETCLRAPQTRLACCACCCVTSDT